MLANANSIILLVYSSLPITVHSLLKQFSTVFSTTCYLKINGKVHIMLRKSIQFRRLYTRILEEIFITWVLCWAAYYEGRPLVNANLT